MLTSLPVDPMGLASHPDFAQNRFVYLSLLEHPRADERRLRVLRLREVGDTLGEPATLFDAPVAMMETRRRPDHGWRSAPTGCST